MHPHGSLAISLIASAITVACGARTPLSDDELGMGGAGDVEAGAVTSASSASSTGAGGGREACRPGELPETLVANVDGAHGLAQDDANLYFTIAAKDTGSIVVARKHDGDTSVLDSGLKAPRDIVHVGGQVFYTTHNGHLLRVGVDGGATPFEIATDLWATQEVEGGAGYVYWAAGFEIWRTDAEAPGSKVSLGDGINATHIALYGDGLWLSSTWPGGESGSEYLFRLHQGLEIFQHPLPPLEDLRADASHVYFATAASVWRFDPYRTGKHLHISDATLPNGLFITDSHVYWTEQGNGPGAGFVKRYAKRTGDIDVLAEGQNTPRRVVVDDTCAYWTNEGYDGAPGAVMRVAR